MQCGIRIERDRNGYEVSVTDPKMAEANQKSDSDWKDPNTDYQFKTKEQVLSFLDKIIDDALPVDAYAAAFDKAAEDSLDD